MISVITPHFRGTNQWIAETYNSLLAQQIDWQWVLVVNNGGMLPLNILRDKRVKLIEADSANVGMLKRIACQQADGEYIVELDADDLLVPDALVEIAAALQEAPFVYSDCAEFYDGTWESRTFSKYWGWQSYPFEYNGHKLTSMQAFEPSPHMMRTIWWAPNHVRAWRAVDYWAIGGHADMPLADDHDLCCRFYLHGQMKRIPKTLYLYRLHGDNTCLTRAAEIQDAMWQNYNKYFFPMCCKWARDNGLGLIDLGGRFGKPDGFYSIDLRDADVCYDLNKGIPAKDNSIGVVRAADVLEHLADPVHTMNEIHRVLAPGGFAFISVPSTDGRGAFQAPDHVSFWCSNSMWYYTNPQYAKYVDGIRCKFNISRVIDWYPSEFHKFHNIVYTDAHLIALKDGYKPVGENLWQS